MTRLNSVLIAAICFGASLTSLFGGLAPSESEILTVLPGQTIQETTFTSSSRFSWNGELGNWTYELVSENVGSITQTYDGTNNNPGVYREETVLTFSTSTSGTYVYREYDSNQQDFQQSGSFDFPWLESSGNSIIQAEGWIYITWPYAYALDDARWYYINTSDQLSRVNLSSNEWGYLSDATGWHYFAWPYSYSVDQSAWHWYTDDTQWVVDLLTGQWSLLGYE